MTSGRMRSATIRVAAVISGFLSDKGGAAIDLVTSGKEKVPTAPTEESKFLVSSLQDLLDQRKGSVGYRVSNYKDF